jgi:hypothetical protein
MTSDAAARHLPSTYLRLCTVVLLFRFGCELAQAAYGADGQASDALRAFDKSDVAAFRTLVAVSGAKSELTGNVKDACVAYSVTGQPTALFSLKGKALPGDVVQLVSSGGAHTYRAVYAGEQPFPSQVQEPARSFFIYSSGGRLVYNTIPPRKTTRWLEKWLDAKSAHVLAAEKVSKMFTWAEDSARKATWLVARKDGKDFHAYEPLSAALRGGTYSIYRSGGVEWIAIKRPGQMPCHHQHWQALCAWGAIADVAGYRYGKTDTLKYEYAFFDKFVRPSTATAKEYQALIEEYHEHAPGSNQLKQYSRASYRDPDGRTYLDFVRGIDLVKEYANPVHNEINISPLAYWWTIDANVEAMKAPHTGLAMEFFPGDDDGTTGESSKLVAFTNRVAALLKDDRPVIIASRYFKDVAKDSAMPSEFADKYECVKPVEISEIGHALVIIAMKRKSGKEACFYFQDGLLLRKTIGKDVIAVEGSATADLDPANSKTVSKHIRKMRNGEFWKCVQFGGTVRYVQKDATGAIVHSDKGVLTRELTGKNAPNLIYYKH